MTPADRAIRELWDRAVDSLKAAEILASFDYWDFAASRAYYAAFYAASALLLTEGKRFSKHSGVISHIHKDFVKTGRIPAEVGKLIDSLSDMRDVGDCGGSTHVESDEGPGALADARRFLDAIRPLLPLPREPPGDPDGRPSSG